MISLISFGVSWLVYALVFAAIALSLPQYFHSTYREVIFQVGFLIGFVDTLIMRVVRAANFKLHWIGLILLATGITWALLVMSDNSVQDYSITGNLVPFITALVLGIFVVGFETLKNRVISNVRI
jgi:hypothetical protein